MENNKTIRVCKLCGTPLIFTLAFDYNERYCLNCGNMGDIFSGKDIKATREMIFKHRLVESIWEVLYSRKGMVPIGSLRRNCKKCDKGDRHINHMSKADEEWNRIARGYLARFQGIFDLK